MLRLWLSIFLMYLVYCAKNHQITHTYSPQCQIQGLRQKKLYNGFYDNYQLLHVLRDDFRSFLNLLMGEFQRNQTLMLTIFKTYIFGHMDMCHMCSEDVTLKPLRSRSALWPFQWKCINPQILKKFMFLEIRQAENLSILLDYTPHLKWP